MGLPPAGLDDFHRAWHGRLFFWIRGGSSAKQAGNLVERSLRGRKPDALQR